MKLNEKLKKLRIENKMTQRELANKLGISIPTLQKYEYGTLKIKNEIILALCEIFKISPNVFFNDETNNMLKELDEFEKKEYRKNRALLVIEKIRKDIQKKEEIEKQRQIKLSDYRTSEINEKMETFEDFYYYEESLEINQLEFKNLFPLIRFLMSYFELDIEINREMEHSPYVKIYSEKLKIKYELSTEEFEEFLTFLNDELIHNFFSLLDYRFSNEFEEEQDEEYEIIEDEEDDEWCFLTDIEFYRDNFFKYRAYFLNVGSFKIHYRVITLLKKFFDKIYQKLFLYSVTLECFFRVLIRKNIYINRFLYIYIKL